MDSATHQIIIQAIQGKLGSRTLVCPISGEDATWDVLTYSTLLPAVDQPGASVSLGAPAFPLAVLMCKDCGYFMLINLIGLGVAEQLSISVKADE